MLTIENIYLLRDLVHVAYDMTYTVFDIDSSTDTYRIYIRCTPYEQPTTPALPPINEYLSIWVCRKTTTLRISTRMYVTGPTTIDVLQLKNPAHAMNYFVKTIVGQTSK
jgi:hypothetical protein